MSVFKKGLGYLLKDFSCWTSTHGIPHIGMANAMWLRIMWILVVCCCILGFIIQLEFLIKKYLSYRVNTETVLEYSERPFPVITVCHMNPWKLDAVQASPFMKDMIAAYTDTTEQHPEFGFFAFNGERQQTAQALTSLAFDYLQDLVNDVDNITAPEDPAYTYDDLIVSCTYNAETCNSSDFTNTMDQYFGRCLTFNSNETQMSSRAGPLYGLQLTIKTDMSQYLPWTDSSGVVISIHNKSDPPYPDIYGYYAPPGIAASLALDFTTTTRLPAPFGDCTELQETEMQNYNGMYQTEACIRSCLQEQIVLQCKCYSPALNYISHDDSIPSCFDPDDPTTTYETYGQCIYDIMYNTAEGFDMNTNCTCPQPCVDNEFAVTVSTALWPANMYTPNECTAADQSGEPWYVAGQNDTKEACIAWYQKNTLLVEIFYEQMNYNVLSESQAYSLVSLISEIGGQVGLFLGMSIISVFEFLTLVLLIIYYVTSHSSRKVELEELEKTIEKTKRETEEMRREEEEEDKRLREKSNHQHMRTSCVQLAMHNYALLVLASVQIVCADWCTMCPFSTKSKIHPESSCDDGVFSLRCPDDNEMIVKGIASATISFISCSDDEWQAISVDNATLEIAAKKPTVACKSAQEAAIDWNAREAKLRYNRHKPFKDCVDDPEGIKMAGGFADQPNYKCIAPGHDNGTVDVLVIVNSFSARASALLYPLLMQQPEFRMLRLFAQSGCMPIEPIPKKCARYFRALNLLLHKMKPKLIFLMYHDSPRLREPVEDLTEDDALIEFNDFLTSLTNTAQVVVLDEFFPVPKSFQLPGMANNIANRLKKKKTLDDLHVPYLCEKPGERFVTTCGQWKENEHLSCFNTCETLGKVDFLESEDGYYQRLGEIHYPNLIRHNTSGPLCNADKPNTCYWYNTKNFRSYFTDDLHLSPAGLEVLKPSYADVVNQAFRRLFPSPASASPPNATTPPPDGANASAAATPIASIGTPPANGSLTTPLVTTNALNTTAGATLPSTASENVSAAVIPPVGVPVSATAQASPNATVPNGALSLPATVATSPAQVPVVSPNASLPIAANNTAAAISVPQQSSPLLLNASTSAVPATNASVQTVPAPASLTPLPLPVTPTAQGAAPLVATPQSAPATNSSVPAAASVTRTPSTSALPQSAVMQPSQLSPEFIAMRNNLAQMWLANMQQQGGSIPSSFALSTPNLTANAAPPAPKS